MKRLRKWWQRLCGTDELLTLLSAIEDAISVQLPLPPTEYSKAISALLQVSLRKFSAAGTDEQRCFYQGVCSVLQDLMDSPARLRFQEAIEERARQEAAEDDLRRKELTSGRGYSGRGSRPI